VSEQATCAIHLDCCCNIVFVRRGRDRDGDVEDDGPSRADASDNWGMNRAPLPAEPARSGSAFGERRSGGGFADRDSFSSGR